MADWRETAHRGIDLFNDDSSEEGSRTARLLRHILDESNRDDYISRDFYNVQQTAGGLPEGVTLEQYLSAITGRMRSGLESSSFDSSVDDASLRTAFLTFDGTIRRHIQFLNGVVHQGAVGDVHRSLWEQILASRSDPRSLYSHYSDYLVDA